MLIAIRSQDTDVDGVIVTKWFASSPQDGRRVGPLFDTAAEAQASVQLWQLIEVVKEVANQIGPLLDSALMLVNRVPANLTIGQTDIEALTALGIYVTPDQIAALFNMVEQVTSFMTNNATTPSGAAVVTADYKGVIDEVRSI